jgi:hypothetical protein
MNFAAGMYGKALTEGIKPAGFFYNETQVTV